MTSAETLRPPGPVRYSENFIFFFHTETADGFVEKNEKVKKKKSSYLSGYRLKEDLGLQQDVKADFSAQSGSTNQP